jgi:hypothetical protein
LKLDILGNLAVTLVEMLHIFAHPFLSDVPDEFSIITVWVVGQAAVIIDSAAAKIVLEVASQKIPLVIRLCHDRERLTQGARQKIIYVASFCNCTRGDLSRWKYLGRCAQILP